MLTGDVAFGENTPLVEAPDNAPEPFKPIALAANALTVAGDVEFSGAVPDIRANGDITITVKDPRGRLNIQATGNITVNQVAGKTTNVLKVG